MTGIETLYLKNTGTLSWTADTKITGLTDGGLSVSAGTSIYFDTGGSESMTITHGGSVGIGTPSPANLLHIKGDPSVDLGDTNYASTNGFGQLHIETSTEWTGLGTGKLKIGVQQPTGSATKSYIQSINDNTLAGQLLLNPSGGNVGINTTNPVAPLQIDQTVSNDAIRYVSADDNYTWRTYATNDNKFWIYSNTTAKGGWVDGTVSGGQMNFTGQHKNIMNTNIDTSKVGLIVSATNNYVNIDNSLNTNINESLPICTITNTDNDKKVFGVISDKEDTNTSREYASGNFVSVNTKTNTNEQRMFINSVGEGAIWVCNKNGALEIGDYISSTTVSGYGGKQNTNADFLMNYTVAKITCDCDFSITKIVKQKLKVTTTTDSNNSTTTAIDYDNNGDIQYEDDLDDQGSQQMVYQYQTRFLEADGTLLVDEADYLARLALSEAVYIACFVGCTYHCG